MKWIVGTHNSNGSEYCVFNSQVAACGWLEDRVNDGFTEDELVLFRAEPVELSVSMTAVVEVVE